ncbi:MAG: hypothetical protein ABI402_17490 [Ferruginibacter sp.]
MKRKSFITILLLIVVCLSSCGIFRDKNLAKRFRNHDNKHLFGNSYNPQLFVQVDLNSANINEPESKEVKFNVLSLSDKGQEAFINSANLKTATPALLMDLLNTNFAFSKEDKPKIKIISKTVKKTLIFTVDRLQYHFDPIPLPGLTTFNKLGDRISYLELNVVIPPADHAIFNTWDRYVTDKLTLNLGKVSAAQNWNASLNLSAKGSGEVSLSGSKSNEGSISDQSNGSTTLVNTGPVSSTTNGSGYQLLSTDTDANSKTNSVKGAAELGGSATIGFTDKYETSLDLTSQILKLSGSLAERKILLRQEGGPGIDLSGNVVVSVEYVLTDDWATPVYLSKFKNLYTPAGVPNLPAAINQSFLTLIFPDIHANVTGQLNYSFLYRQVNKGNRHLPEARQKVKYRYGSVSYNQNTVLGMVPVNLIRPEDVRPKAYQIILPAPVPPNTLEYGGGTLVFETASDATSFLAYIGDLLHISPLPAVAPLTIGGVPITLAVFPLLRVSTLNL